MRSKARSLDEYQRYIKERESVQTIPTGTGGEISETKAPAVAPPAMAPLPAKNGLAKAQAAAKAAPAKTRYVLRGGVTVAVTEAESEASVVSVVVTAPPAAATVKPPSVPGRQPEPKTVLLPDTPETVGAAEKRGAAAISSEGASDTPASLWERLPRHIQLLAQIPAPLEEEVAQKYYSRGFRESREELIERLLDPPLTLEDTARVLGVCPATVRRYTNRGVLLHQRTVGQQRRFRLSDVLLFLEKQQTKASRGKK